MLIWSASGISLARFMSHSGLRFASAALALAVFLVDVLTPLEGAVAVLYVTVILLAAKTGRRNDIIVAAAGCAALTIAAYLLSHDLTSIASPALRALVSLAAIVITTLLAVQNQAATGRLAAQARLLNLSHDMTHSFREVILGGVLVAPLASYAALSLVLFLLLRPVLHGIGFSRFFSNPSLAELSLYVTLFGLLTLFF